MDFTDFSSCGIDHVFTFVSTMSQPCPLSVHQKHLKGKKSWERGWVIRFLFDYPRLIETSTKKTGFFWVPNILKEIKDSSNNRRKPSEQDRFVDEQTRMKWKYGWHVWSHLSFFFTILLRVFVFLHPRPSALILGRRPSTPISSALGTRILQD